MLISLIAGALAAALPPGDEAIRPPGEVRAAEVAPSKLSDLDKGRRLVRVWWDSGPHPPAEGAIVEALVRDRWTVVALGASPGVSAGRLEPGARVRVRWPGGVPSDPVAPARGAGPGEVSRLAGEGLQGSVAADIGPDEAGAWVALLDGGLARLQKDDLKVTQWGLYEGLPSGQVNAVAAGVDASGAPVAWVGTAAGLARLRDGEVDRVWTTAHGLPDDWVQALWPIEETGGVWVGTYQGLAKLTPGEAVEDTVEVEQVLAPWSVFSLSPGPPGELWAGYAGVHTLPSGEPVAGVSDELDVWDADVLGPRAYLATGGQGLVVLEEGEVSPWWEPSGGAVYALERVGGQLYAAAGGQGLVALSDSTGLSQRWDQARGLPSSTVYEVVAGPPRKLWVGTAGGVAMAWPERDVVVPWPLSPAAAGVSARAVVADRRGAVLAGDEGAAALSKIPRGWRGALAVPGPVLTMVELGRSLWLIGLRDAWVAEGGELRRVALPGPVRAAVEVNGALWVGGPGGLHRYDPALERFVPGPRVGAVTALAADAGTLWAGVSGGVLAMGSTGEVQAFEVNRPDVIAPSPEGIWLGDAVGLALLNPADGSWVRVSGVGEGVMALGRAGGKTWMSPESGGVYSLPELAPLEGSAAAEVGSVYAISGDERGRLWVMGSVGAFVVTPR